MGGGRRPVTGVPWWIVVMLACSGVAVGEKLTTVAYVMDSSGFASLRNGWGLPAAMAEDDPFAEEEGEGSRPILLTVTPKGTRFLKEGDRMWSLTSCLREETILKDERSWAVWNAETNRLVVYGTAVEHGLFAMVWAELRQDIHAVIEVKLLKVPCREVGSVSWTDQEVLKRGGERVLTASAAGRLGSKIVSMFQAEGGEARLEAEANHNVEQRAVDLRFEFSAPVRHADDFRQVRLITAIKVCVGHAVYIEVGGASAEDVSYVVRVKAEPQFLGGRSIWKWREFENPSIEETRPEVHGWRHERVITDDGMIVSHFSVPPIYHWSHDVYREGKGGLDRMEVPTHVPGFSETDAVYDVGGLMNDHGVNIPEGGWARVNLTRGLMVVKLDAANTERVVELMKQLHRRTIGMIHGTACLIEWSGEPEPGTVPTRWRRLARVGVLLCPGQKATSRHAWPGDELKRGVVLELEPNVGDDNEVIFMRMALEVAGERAVELSTGLTLTTGKPVLVPLGEEGGKKFGVVVSGRVIDGTGKGIERRE